MEEKEQDFLSDRLLKIDLYSLLRDLVRNWWVILLCCIMLGMWGNLYASYLSHSGSTYTASSTLIVSVKGSESNVYSNLSSAQTMATSLSNIMQSNLMKKRVCTELELDSFTATVTPSVINNTNLMSLSVTDSSPERAYRVLRSILNNYEDIAKTVMGGIMVETLKEATVPTYNNHHVNVDYYTRRGGLFGILLGIALIAFMSIMNDTVKSSQDLSDKIDAKPLGTIYFEHKYKTVKSMVKHKKSSILITNPATSFAFVESYKKISAKISYLKKMGEGLSVVITSILENEGKSTVSINIALTLLQNGNHVIIVDCDLRKPALDLVLFGQKTTGHTLHDYLTGKCRLEDIILVDEKTGLSIITTGQEIDSASELLSGEVMRDMIRELKTRYDYVILDTPPLSAAADAESLADHSDMSVLVIKYDQVQVADINDAIDLLDGCRAEVAGCVLNQVHVLGRPGVLNEGIGYGSYYYSGRGRNHER